MVVVHPRLPKKHGKKARHERLSYKFLIRVVQKTIKIYSLLLLPLVFLKMWKASLSCLCYHAQKKQDPETPWVGSNEIDISWVKAFMVLEGIIQVSKERRQSAAIPRYKTTYELHQLLAWHYIPEGVVVVHILHCKTTSPYRDLKSVKKDTMSHI